MAAQGVIPGGDPAKLDRVTAPVGPLAATLLRLILDHDPATDEVDIVQLGRHLPGGAEELAMWLNELGYLRLEHLPDRLWEHLHVLITRAGATGQMLRLERRETNGSRTHIGGIDSLARWMTSLQPPSNITAVDPLATGRYTIDASAGVSPLQVRHDTDDLVRMQGRVAVSAAGTGFGQVVFALPSASWRPATNRMLPVVTTTGIACPCELLPSGDMVLRRTQAGALSLAFDDLTYSRRAWGT